MQGGKAIVWFLAGRKWGKLSGLELKLASRLPMRYLTKDELGVLSCGREEKGVVFWWKVITKSHDNCSESTEELANLIEMREGWEGVPDVSLQVFASQCGLETSPILYFSRDLDISDFTEARRPLKWMGSARLPEVWYFSWTELLINLSRNQ